MKYTKIIATLLVSSSLAATTIGSVAYAEENNTNSESIYYGSAVENAMAAVNALFADSHHTVLSPTATSESLKQARSLLLKISITDAHFRELYDLCNKAEKLLNQSANDPSVQKARDAVHALFNDNTYTTIAPKTTSASIKEARTLLLKMPVTNKNFKMLLELCNKAEKLLNQTTNDPSAHNAMSAVHALFSDDTYTALATTTTAASIKEARRLLLQMPVTNSNLLPLANLCNKAETLLLLQNLN